MKVPNSCPEFVLTIEVKGYVSEFCETRLMTSKS